MQRTKMKSSLVNILSVLILSPVNPLFVCRDGWAFYEDNCYLQPKGKLTWIEALMECSRRNSRLVESESFDENKFILSTFPKMAWMGLRLTNDTDDFTWMSGNTVGSFRRFYLSDPKYEPGLGCGVINFALPGFGMWGAGNCTLKLNYICETFDDEE